MKAKVKQKKVKTNKRTRGYRLKPTTHTLIAKIQELLQSDQDMAIASACNLFYEELQKNGSAKSTKQV